MSITLTLNLVCKKKLVVKLSLRSLSLSTVVTNSLFTSKFNKRQVCQNKDGSFLPQAAPGGSAFQSFKKTFSVVVYLQFFFAAKIFAGGSSLRMWESGRSIGQRKKDPIRKNSLSLIIEHGKLFVYQRTNYDNYA